MKHVYEFIDVEKQIKELREQVLHTVFNNTNIFETNKEKVSGEIAIPGFKKEELSIRCHPKYLEISGKVETPRYRRVRSTFYRKINFNQRIDPDTINISLAEGILKFEVTLEQGKEVKIIDF